MYVCMYCLHIVLISYRPRPDLKMLVVSISSHTKLYMLMATAKLHVSDLWMQMQYHPFGRRLHQHVPNVST